MTDTGRLRVPAASTIRRLLLERRDPGRPPWKEERSHVSLVGLAHVVMLSEQRIVDRSRAAALLSAVLDLRAQDFAPLESRPTPRGLYLAYESHLIEQHGADVGGVLHTGRSRNDLSATCLHLALREPYLRLASGLVELGIVLLNRARRYRDVLMPAYTHFQAAVPITFGHYLLGLAAALARDWAALRQAAVTMERCPLGAGAVGGTTIPIDARRTAALLGFREPVLNSVDAVASRDVILRLLAAAATLGVSLDRAALDLLLWSTAEFDLVTIPDELVGSSSMMPQKRNPFVLEHVQGRSATALGSFVGAASAMRGTPFTNSISVGTEGAAHIWAGLQASADAVTIMRLVFVGLRPNTETMAARVESGLTTATALAERLASSGMPFRRAHHEVGAAVLAVANGRAVSLPAALADRGGADLGADLDAASVRRAADFGGGPGPASFERAHHSLAGEWLRHRSSLAEQAGYWATAQRHLEAAVADVLGRG
jgi:argininosuccinate lyase